MPGKIANVSAPAEKAADQQTSALRKRLKWLLWLPVPPSWACWGWLKKLFCTPEMKAKRRMAEKERQAGVRRELRGLPATPDKRNGGNG